MSRSMNKCGACFVPSLQTAAETVQLQLWRAAIRTLLTGKEKKTEKWNQTAEQSRRPLSLQRGYFRGMTESDALRGLKDPKVRTLPKHKCSVTFPPSATSLLLHTDLGGVSQYCTLLKYRQNFLAVQRLHHQPAASNLWTGRSWLFFGTSRNKF